MKFEGTNIQKKSGPLSNLHEISIFCQLSKFLFSDFNEQFFLDQGFKIFSHYLFRLIWQILPTQFCCLSL